MTSSTRTRWWLSGFGLARVGPPNGLVPLGPPLQRQTVGTGFAGAPVTAAIPLVSHTSVRRARWGGVKGLERLARAGLGDRAGSISLVPTAEFRSRLLALAATRPPAIAVLGGDGTARTALEVLTPLGIPVVPLPGGTLNRLSRLVYGTASATAILRRVVASGRVRALPGARLGEHRFFVACGFGMAMGMHGVREGVRRGDVAAAIKAFASAARHLFAPSVTIHAGGPSVGWREDTVQMAVVAVGPLAPAFGLPVPMNPAPSLGPGQGGLEVVTARLTGWWQLVGLAPRAFIGSWPEGPGITREARDTVQVAPIGAAGPVPGLLDGEPIQLDGAAVILFDPACGLVMAD